MTFEKETAAKTALLLDNTQLGPAQVHVSAAKSLEELAPDEHKEHDDVPQEDKPRSRIIAEYLAHGYAISDKAIERAIALDKQHGFSTRFTAALKAFDEKTKASERAAAVDQKFAVSATASQGWRSMSSYFEKALGTPTGQKLRKFYEDGNKQVIDVHNEARHLADLKAGKAGAKAATEGESSHANVSAEEAGVHQVEGDRTQCNCGSTTEKCPCPPGKCACPNCAKNPTA